MKKAVPLALFHVLVLELISGVLSIVGAISPSFPFCILLNPVLSAKQGTKLVLCAVLGVPSEFNAKSALPWSAIMIKA